jgi:glycosyl transferase, family 25
MNHTGYRAGNSQLKQMKINLMPKCYILTLHSLDQGSVQSKVRILSSRLGEIEVFRGVDGRELPAMEYYKFMVGARGYIKHGQILTPGEVGCALSHVRMLQEFLNSNAQIVVIFEDDVIIGKQSVEKLMKALRFMRSTDILVACNQRGLYAGNFRALPLAEYDECYEVQKDHWINVKRTCAYALGRGAAKHILSVQKGALCLADDFQALCPDDGRLLFCDAFGHLETYEGSNIETERQLQRSRPRPLIIRLRDELMKTVVHKTRPAMRAIRSALGGHRAIGK